MTAAVALVTALAYNASAMLAWRGTARTAATGLAAAALVLHAGLLLGAIFKGGNLALGVTEASSVFSWQAAVLLWLLCLLRPVQALGIAIYPLAAVAVLGAALMPTSITAIPLADWKIQMHVVLSLFSAGFLTLAAAQALTLAIQDRLLHSHEPNRIVRALPPLQAMEQLLFLLIGLGFFILTLALLSGLIFVDDLMAQHLAHKTVLSVLAWAMFGALLWGRWRRGWRGRTAIRWALSGYGMLVLAYFGSKLVLEQILSRHWT
ncbi:MAG TPA: cytochrome c biogenesis protein CcsA [Verrucomicrobiae bacterium]|nr:cytochrome c biogenesis protein CcsA [Verrucomicrobiae bacterium]